MAEDTYGRIVLAAAGVIGGAGVILAAASSHGGDEHLLGAASTICLAHGPALLALGLSTLKSRMLRIAAGALIVGTLLFAADLITRHYAGAGLFPGAAPLGGGAMILGWAAVAAGAFSRSK